MVLCLLLFTLWKFCRWKWDGNLCCTAHTRTHTASAVATGSSIWFRCFIFLLPHTRTCGPIIIYALWPVLWLATTCIVYATAKHRRFIFDEWFSCRMEIDAWPETGRCRTSVMRDRWIDDMKWHTRIATHMRKHIAKRVASFFAIKFENINSINFELRRSRQSGQFPIAHEIKTRASQLFFVPHIWCALICVRACACVFARGPYHQTIFHLIIIMNYGVAFSPPFRHKCIHLTVHKGFAHIFA